MNNGKRRSDKDLLTLLDEFEGMMQVMIDNGVTYHSFKEHIGRLYVASAVTISDGNYCEAARKIGLHRNNVTRIMGSRKARLYVQQFKEAQNGEPHSE